MQLSRIYAKNMTDLVFGYFQTLWACDRVVREEIGNPHTTGVVRGFPRFK